MLRMLLRFGPFSFFQKGEEMLTMLRPHFGTFFQVAGITSQKSSRSSWARRGCQRVWTLFSHSLSKTLAVSNRLRLGQPHQFVRQPVLRGPLRRDPATGVRQGLSDCLQFRYSEVSHHYVSITLPKP